ncbi:unnamed protein product [Miscanthus lutarioriparius]|uniref:Uncharacterized protein n=1 Tax=Miscanthus lutarioriparius TaxID=422564 RepID=A0A811PP00_9POAL|nr:unnamed protein product [Miscanthus lutarioriparius]
MQNMMDGHHQLAMMQQQQQQHQNHGQQQQQQPQAATSESDAHGPRHDELLMESKSASDNMEGGAGSGSGGEELQEHLSLQPARKKRYHRHTQHQIQEYPHPDDKQRKELSRELGLEPLQEHIGRQVKKPTSIIGTELKMSTSIGQKRHSGIRAIP